MLAEKIRNHHGKGAAVYQDHKLTFAQFGTGCGRTFGITCLLKKAESAPLQKWGQIAGIEQNRNLHLVEAVAHPAHQLRRGQIAVIEQGNLGGSTLPADQCLHRESLGSDQTAQQTDVDSQKIAEALTGAADISLP